MIDQAILERIRAETPGLRNGVHLLACGSSLMPQPVVDAIIDHTRLEAEIGKLGGLLSDPDLFGREPVKFRKATEALADRQSRLAAAEEEWLLLEEKAES